jgi:hypothetical protein
MEHIAALLLIVGCSADLRNCSELPAPVPIYETYEECEANRTPTLSAFAGLRDKVFAQCVYVDPAMEEEDAELFWDIGANGELHAVIEPAGSTVATTAIEEPADGVSASR